MGSACIRRVSGWLVYVEFGGSFGQRTVALNYEKRVAAANLADRADGKPPLIGRDVRRPIRWYSAMKHDVFVSHAWEDKAEVARPLAEALVERGFRVWYDEFELRLGDSLSEIIDRGLASSTFGVVILSPHFFQKQWPRRELRGLVAREADGRKVILPVWHKVSREDVVKASPTLADLLAANTTDGLEYVVGKIIEVVAPFRVRSDEALDRAEELFATGHIQASIITAAVFLGAFLRERAVSLLGFKYFKKQPLRSYPLRSLFDLLLGKGAIAIESQGERVNWEGLIRMRNIAVHRGDDEVLSPEACRWYIEQVRLFVQINSEKT